MLQTSVLPLPTQDLSTDAEFDYYGLRLAICGVDQKYIPLLLYLPSIPIC